jgi:uncharacterized protein YndB with AHSA1/START domain
MVLSKETTTIKQTVIIPNASPKQVYDAYTDPKKHTEFTGSKTSGKPVAGGKYSAWDGYIFGKYISLVEGKCVVQDWATTDWEKGYAASKLELSFRAVPEGTEVTLTQTGVPKVQAEEFEQGWVDFYWKPLKDHFKK